ncbi:MAG: ATP-binding protein [Candidatus Omnitrophica bacterium]|nr:ATP-binding protein [Candidatus Omnitrophota bacterium]
MVRENDTLIGREQELKRIHAAVRRGTNVLIWGEKGSGKTAFLHEFMKQQNVLQARAGVMLVSTQCASFKDTCLALLGCLFERDLLVKVPKETKILNSDLPWAEVQTHFSRLRATVLKNLVLSNLCGIKNLTVVLDHVGKIKLKFYLLLDALRDYGRLILVTRSEKRQDAGRLWMLLWGFEKIEIKPLTPYETKRLARIWLEGINPGGPDSEKWFDELARRSHGNPRILRGLCEAVCTRMMQTKANTANLRLANIDREISDFIKEK